jgi:DNA-binding GntR family transcriptional regulator
MIVQESLVTMAAAQIEKMIRTGALAPGQRITEPRLAEELGISRPPLREALRMLAGHGLLAQTPRRGYRVIELTQTDLDEIFSLRHVLEGYAFKLIADSPGAADLRGASASCARMRAALEAADVAAFAEANEEFHMALIHAAGHGRLSQVYTRLLMQMQVTMASDIYTEAERSGDLAGAFARHDALLQALLSGDRDRVRAAHAAHGPRPLASTPDPPEGLRPNPTPA